MHWLRKVALATVLGVGMACSALLDFDLEVECWCGEKWKAQISGAHALRFDGTSASIPASKTNYEVCVSQLEHIALDTADSQNPFYVALRNNLESGAIAQCEAAGAQAASVGDDEAGDDLAWECDEPGLAELEIQQSDR